MLAVTLYLLHFIPCRIDHGNTVESLIQHCSNRYPLYTLVTFNTIKIIVSIRIIFSNNNNMKSSWQLLVNNLTVNIHKRRSACVFNSLFMGMSTHMDEHDLVIKLTFCEINEKPTIFSIISTQFAQKYEWVSALHMK